MKSIINTFYTTLSIFTYLASMRQAPCYVLFYFIWCLLNAGYNLFILNYNIYIYKTMKTKSNN